MDDLKLVEKIKKLPLEDQHTVITYIDYLIETKVKPFEDKDNSNKGQNQNSKNKIESNE